VTHSSGIKMLVSGLEVWYLPSKFKALSSNSSLDTHTHTHTHTHTLLVRCVRKMISSIKVFVTLLDYLKIPQVAILGDLHV
jgi:hypothetical protein